MRRLEPDWEKSTFEHLNSATLQRKFQLPPDKIKIEEDEGSYRQVRKVLTEQAEHMQSLSSLVEHIHYQQPHSEHFKSGDIIILTQEHLILPCSFQTAPMFSSLVYREYNQYNVEAQPAKEDRICFQTAEQQTKFMIKTRGPSFYRQKLQQKQQQLLYENFHLELNNIVQSKQKKVIKLKGKSPDRKKKSENLTLPSLQLTESTNRYLRTHTKQQRSTENSLKSRYIHMTLNSSPFKPGLKTPQKLLNRPKNIPIFLGNQKSSAKGIRVFSTSKQRRTTIKQSSAQNILPTCCPSDRQLSIKNFDTNLSTQRKKQGKKIQSIHTMVGRNTKAIKLYKNV